MGGKVSLGTIGQIAVYVKDLDRAVSFYRDTLGMDFLFQAPPGLAFFDCGGIRLMLDLPEAGTDEAARGTSIIYYKVADIDAAYNQFTTRGAVSESAPHKIADMPDHALWMAFIKDTEGNTIGLMEERRGP